MALIFLLMAGQVWAYGSAKEDTSAAITFVHSIGMDSVRYYASQDTSSWEINRLMVRAFSDDSTNYALVDTFDNSGTYFVKIEYWEGGAASAKYLPDIRDISPTNAVVNIVDRGITLAKFDTAAAAAYYDFGIWLDDGAGNANTTVGVDGTRANPVSTLAAARILADSMGLQKYYLTNNSSFTLAATYEDWCFHGLGESNEINFGSQDVDNSHFEHLMVAGVQGGTGLIWLDECYMDAADSLECVARNSWFSDTVSVRVATNIIFDNCFSNIPGNNTPGIDFNSPGGAVTVSFRHYSGGMGFINGNSNVTISIETDGQIVIDASCTSINVTARGNMSITDNGTTTSLTDDAVFNTSQNVGVNWNDIDNKTSVVDLTQTLIDTDQKVDLNTDQPGFINAYPQHIFKTVVRGSPTTTTFEVSYIDPTPDNTVLLAGMILLPITGNALGTVVNIATWTIADSEFVVTPSFGSSPNSGDTVLILPQRGGVEATTRTQNRIDITATGEVALDYSNVNGQIDGEDFTSAYYDSVALRADSGLAAINNILRTVAPHIGSVNDAAPTSSQFIVDATLGTYGDDFFNDKYMLFITGNLMGWPRRITDFETTNDTIKFVAFDIAPANGDSFVVSPGNFDILRDSTSYQGAAGSLTASEVADSIFLRIVANDTTSGGVDTVFADYVVSTALSVGKDGVSTTNVTLQMKAGAYTGAAGSNIEDDFDSVFVDIAAISAPGGSGAFSCSLFAWDGASAITSGSIRMISGVNEYVLPIDANGWVEFSLDGGTWSAYATALRFIQDTIPQTITFSTHHIDTISMTAFSPSTPTDTGKVVLYVWTDRILGDTLEGATFRVIPLDKGKNWVTGGNRILLTGEITVKTDSTGYAEIEVYQSSYTHPYPSGSDSLKYNISVTYPGLGYWAQPGFVAPDSGNQYQMGVIE